MTFCDENVIPCLRSQSWDIAQYPEIAKQSNCTILGGSRVAYTNGQYTHQATILLDSNEKIFLIRININYSNEWFWASFIIIEIPFYYCKVFPNVLHKVMGKEGGHWILVTNPLKH